MALEIHLSKGRRFGSDQRINRDLREGDQKTTKPPVQRKHVTDKVIDALTSTDVLDKIMPVLTQKITETIVSVIESSIQSCVDSIETVKRQQITINKKSLKGDQDGVFFTENLTKYRTELVKRLSQLKFHRQIYTYRTSDGRIYVRKLETSRKQLVTNFDDIENIECSVHEQTASQTSDTEIYH